VQVLGSGSRRLTSSRSAVAARRARSQFFTYSADENPRDHRPDPALRACSSSTAARVWSVSAQDIILGSHRLPTASGHIRRLLSFTRLGSPFGEIPD
jgi:hypothetical protein